MRNFLAIFAGLLIAAGAAQAQVAAPSLAPLQPGSFTANPATLQWSGSSYMGAALISGDFSGTNAGVPDPQLEGDLDGLLLQIRAVGDMFSAAAEILNIEASLGNPTVGAVDFEASFFNVGVAAFVTDTISVGLGIENKDEDFTLTAPVPAPTQTDEFSTTVVGGAIRLTDTIFLGGVLGNESVTPGGSTTEFDRNLMRAGVGILSITSGFQVHLEAYVDNREAFEVPQGGGGVDKALEEKTTALVAEVIWNNILLGVHLINTNTTDVDAAGVTTNDEDVSETILIVGWVPEGGLSIVGSLSSEELEDNQGSGDTEELNLLSVGVAYVF
jgi:hypothetical protein